jgi:hypothetical protein
LRGGALSKIAPIVASLTIDRNALAGVVA